MGFTDDLTAEVVKILGDKWTERDGQKVPDTSDLSLANEGVRLTGTVLYADLADSTGLVLSRTPPFVAAVYKSYLNCACRIIRQTGGEITAFDGDRVMAVFLGAQKNTNAVRAALAINHAVNKILNPKIHEAYPPPKLPLNFAVRHAVGVDSSPLLIARTGIRGSNDLVWVGRAANVAAKLCSLRAGNYTTFITNDVYIAMNESGKVTNGQSMWEDHPETYHNLVIRRSSWFWAL